MSGTKTKHIPLHHQGHKNQTYIYRCTIRDTKIRHIPLHHQGHENQTYTVAPSGTQKPDIYRCTMAGTQKPDIYRCTIREKCGFYPEIQIIFGTVYIYTV